MKQKFNEINQQLNAHQIILILSITQFKSTY